jgi:hypothetical protein
MNLMFAWSEDGISPFGFRKRDGFFSLTSRLGKESVSMSNASQSFFETCLIPQALVRGRAYQ